MNKKILFLIQNPNKGGLKNLVDKWEETLKKSNFQVDTKVVEREKYNLGKYDLVHLFFSPFYSKSLFFRLLIKKIFSRKENVVITYYNIKEDSNLKVFLRKILVKLSANKLALPSRRMVQYYKKLGIEKSFLLMPISNKKNLKSKKKKYVSYFGALRGDKGIRNLIEISKFIKEKIVFAGFSIGSEKSENYLKKIKSSNNFLISKKNHLDIISESKIVLLPYEDLSSTIDTPLAIIEAMERGSVVLASNISPLNAFLPKGCLVDNWGDKKEVLSKIEYLKKNNEKFSEKMVDVVSKLETDEKSFIKNYNKLFS